MERWTIFQGYFSFCLLFKGRQTSIIVTVRMYKTGLPIDGLMENAVPFSSMIGDQENSAE